MDVLDARRTFASSIEVDVLRRIGKEKPDPAMPDWGRVNALVSACCFESPDSGMPIPKVETMSPALQKVLWKVFCDIATVSWGDSKALGELDKALAELRSRFKTEFGSER